MALKWPEEDKLRVVGLLTLDTIYEISRDVDAEKISGTI